MESFVNPRKYFSSSRKKIKSCCELTRLEIHKQTRRARITPETVKVNDKHDKTEKELFLLLSNFKLLFFLSYIHIV